MSEPAQEAQVCPPRRSGETQSHGQALCGDVERRAAAAGCSWEKRACDNSRPDLLPFLSSPRQEAKKGLGGREERDSVPGLGGAEWHMPATIGPTALTGQPVWSTGRSLPQSCSSRCETRVQERGGGRVMGWRTTTGTGVGYVDSAQRRPLVRKQAATRDSSGSQLPGVSIACLRKRDPARTAAKLW